MPEESSLRKIVPPIQPVAELLARHGVEYVIIGGQAETLMGSPRVTYDTDLCYRRTPENIKRLAAALSELGVELRGAPPGLPFKPDAATLTAGLNFTFRTPLGGHQLRWRGRSDRRFRRGGCEGGVVSRRGPRAPDHLPR
jgi:hypothetical protein